MSNTQHLTTPPPISSTPQPQQTLSTSPPQTGLFGRFINLIRGKSLLNVPATVPAKRSADLTAQENISPTEIETPSRPTKRRRADSASPELQQNPSTNTNPDHAMTDAPARSASTNATRAQRRAHTEKDFEKMIPYYLRKPIIDPATGQVNITRERKLKIRMAMEEQYRIWDARVDSLIPETEEDRYVREAVQRVYNTMIATYGDEFAVRVENCVARKPCPIPLDVRLLRQRRRLPIIPPGHHPRMPNMPPPRAIPPATPAFNDNTHNLVSGAAQAINNTINNTNLNGSDLSHNSASKTKINNSKASAINGSTSIPFPSTAKNNHHPQLDLSVLTDGSYHHTPQQPQTMGSRISRAATVEDEFTTNERRTEHFATRAHPSTSAASTNDASLYQSQRNTAATASGSTFAVPDESDDDETGDAPMRDASAPTPQRQPETRNSTKRKRPAGTYEFPYEDIDEYHSSDDEDTSPVDLGLPDVTKLPPLDSFHPPLGMVPISWDAELWSARRALLDAEFDEYRKVRAAKRAAEDLHLDEDHAKDCDLHAFHEEVLLPRRKASRQARQQELFELSMPFGRNKKRRESQERASKRPRFEEPAQETSDTAQAAPTPEAITTPATNETHSIVEPAVTTPEAIITSATIEIPSVVEPAVTDPSKWQQEQLQRQIMETEKYKPKSSSSLRNVTSRLSVPGGDANVVTPQNPVSAIEKANIFTQTTQSNVFAAAMAAMQPRRPVDPVVQEAFARFERENPRWWITEAGGEEAFVRQACKTFNLDKQYPAGPWRGAVPVAFQNL